MIRPARESDLDALVALEVASFRTDRMTRAGFRRVLRGDANAAMLVHDTPGASVTGAALLLFRRNSRAARLYSIAVDRSERGRGLGAKLLAACEKVARSRGCDEMRLEVAEANRPARALYEGHGYVRIRHLPGYYHDGTDGLRYAKPLAARRGR